MGKFSSSRIFYNCSQYIDYIIGKFSEQVQRDGYDINVQKINNGQWDISIKKGGIFKSVLGLQTAMKIKIIATDPNVLVKTEVGIFGRQIVPTAIVMLVFWPVIISQVWGLIKQYKLDSYVMNTLYLDFCQAMGEKVLMKDVE